MKIEELSQLITVRDFAARSYDNPSVKMSKEEANQLRNKLNLLNKTIVQNILKLNILNNENT